MKTISTKDVKSAIRRYDAGERPYRFTKPRAWYLIGSKGRAYPLKYLYALATKTPPTAFKTGDAIRCFRLLDIEMIREPKDYTAEFSKQVAASLKNSHARRERLAKASKMPSLKVREFVVYERNPDVVAEVLANAKGVCQACNISAPFYKKSSGEPYLEVHHIKQLAHGGEDTVENAIAVCPNCHRHAHFG